MYICAKLALIIYSIIVTLILTIKSFFKTNEKSWEFIIFIPTLILLLNLI